MGRDAFGDFGAGRERALRVREDEGQRPARQEDAAALRAPMVALALAILAGLGLDSIREGRWRRPGIALVGFAIGALLLAASAAALLR